MRMTTSRLVAMAGIQQIVKKVPGLFLVENLLTKSQQITLQEKGNLLAQEIFEAKELAAASRVKTAYAKQHNVKEHSGEYYGIQLNDEKGSIKASHFSDYGDKGNTLTYFIGNRNIPNFIEDSLIPRISQIPEVVTLSSGAPLEWRFTFNTYAINSNENNEGAGFGWHKDIKENGEITMIYPWSLSEPLFSIRKEEEKDEVHTFSIPPNSLLGLSGAARYDYEHRVHPKKVDKESSLFELQGEKIWRVSFVLGCTKLPFGKRHTS